MRLPSSPGESNELAHTEQDFELDPEALQVFRQAREARQMRSLRRVKAWDQLRVSLAEPVSAEDVKAAWKQTSAAWAAVRKGGDPEIAEIWEGVFRRRLTEWLNQP